MSGVNVVGWPGSEDEKEEMRCEKNKEEVPTHSLSLSLHGIITEEDISLKCFTSPFLV